MYCTTHNVNVTFFMPEFSISMIIKICFHVDDNKGDTGIGYAMITGRHLMVQLRIISEYNHKLLDCYDGVVTMKETGNLLGKPNITKRDI